MLLTVPPVDLTAYAAGSFPGDSWSSDVPLTLVAENYDLAARFARHLFFADTDVPAWPRVSGLRRPEGPAPTFVPIPYEPWLCLSRFWPTLADELCLGSTKRQTAALVRAACSDLGIQHLLAQPSFTLSTGEVVKALVVAALTVSPDVLLLESGLHAVDLYSRPLLPQVVARYSPHTASVAVETAEPALPGRVWWLDASRVADVSCADVQAVQPLPGLVLSLLRRTGSPSAAATLVLDELSVARGTRTLFRSLSFRATSGDVVGVTGPNGSGKTTLLETILGWRTPSSGAVHLTPSDRPGFCTYAPVSALSVTTELTLLDELILYHPTRTDSRSLLETLGSLGFAEVDARVPLADSPLHRKLASVLTAILSLRPVILLDEPTLLLPRSFHPPLKAAILSAASAGSIVLIASHDVAFLSSLGL